MFFVSSVFFIHASTVIHKAERALLPAALARSKAWWLAKVVFTQVGVGIRSGFRLLGFRAPG
jgi:hypothetical protein